ncbi:DMT family transporter, partial [Actinospica durhamensis]
YAIAAAAGPVAPPARPARPETPPRPYRGRALATGAGAMVLLGASFGVSRALTPDTLYTAQAVRYAAAGLILLAVAKRQGVRLERPRGLEWVWLAGIAAVGLVLFNVAIVRGLAHAEPAVIAVAVACVPVVLGVVGPLIERRVPSRRTLVAAAVVTVGGALVEGTGRADAIGLGWAAVVLVCEACFTLLAVPVLPRHGALGVSLHAIWIGAAAFTVLGLATEGPSALLRITASQWAATAFLTVLVTTVAFILWYSTVAALGPDRAGVITGIAPVAAALTGIALTGRVPGGSVWLGILVVFCGQAVGLLGRRARSTPIE